MEPIKNLPAPLRFGIPVAIVLVLGVVLWLTMFSSPKPSEVVKTRDVGVFNTAKTVLTGGKIPFEEAREGNAFVLTVPPEMETRAAESLASSGLEDRTGKAPEIVCPAPPGFTATKKDREQAETCKQAKDIQQMLLTAGATAANVQVSLVENGTLLGPENMRNVSAQVFLPAHMRDSWDAAYAARAIERAVGAPMERIYIGDDQLQPLYDGSKTGAAGAGSSDSSSGGLGCSDIAGATEIATKEAAVRSCYEQTIAEKLTAMLGSSSRYVLAVEAKVDSTARTTTTSTARTGTVLAESTQSGDGNTAKERQNEPSTSTTNQINPAGDIVAMRLTVALDSKHVTPQQELAVKRLLQTYVDSSRKDPAPTVTRYAFAAGTGSKPENDDLAAMKQAGQGTDAAATLPATQASAALPKPLLAAMAVIVVGLLTAIAVLWLRSTRLAADRSRMQQEFRNEQRLLDDFAQQNPDELARDLESLFGAPPREPALH